jgi:hypothetical protein
MSNFLAIATVTAAIGQILRNAVSKDVAGSDVTSVEPLNSDSGSLGPRVNIFLYQITPNAALRNADLPTKRNDGSLIQRPRVALDLHYILTFYGDDAKLEPQRLLGSAIRTLHQRPVLTKQLIRNTISDPAFSFLASSDLADEIEYVRMTPISFSLEELSKLWSVFFQTPYKLSIAYLATVVIIEGDEAPRAALPVLERAVYAVPFNRPEIESIDKQMVEALSGAEITILGRNLMPESSLVCFEDVQAKPSTGSSNQMIKVALPDSIKPGICAVWIMRQLEIGKPPAPHKGFESNIAVIIVRPILKNIIFDKQRGLFKVDVMPEVGPDEAVLLLLNEFKESSTASLASSPSRMGFILKAKKRKETTGSIEFYSSFTDPTTYQPSSVPPAIYFARIRVGDEYHAESNLNVDLDPSSSTYKEFIGPKVIVE